MRFNTFILILILGGLLLAACSPAAMEPDQAAASNPTLAADGQEGAASTRLLMIVAPQKAACGDGGVRECLQIKFDPEEEWQTIETSIEGFDYQPGYRYTLLVEQLDTKEPPTESALAQFVLVSVQEQAEEMVVSEDSLAGVYWVLVGMGDVSAPAGVLEKVRVSLEYDPEEGRVFGSGGCNRYFGSVNVDADQFVFVTAPIGSGRMGCSQQIMSQESSFLNLLGQVTSFAIQDGMLYLFTSEDEVLLFLPGTPGGR